jgi:Zn-dependent protease with chaperone function
VLIPLLDTLGQATLGMGKVAGIGLVSAFSEWMRQAEFSCDRAGLLVCQDARVAMTAIMKLGGGGTRFDSELNVDAFLEQARQHADSSRTEGIAKALLFLLYNWQISHPQVVFRAKELDRWVEGGAYERVLGGEYLKAEQS